MLPAHKGSLDPSGRLAPLFARARWNRLGGLASTLAAGLAGLVLATFRLD